MGLDQYAYVTRDERAQGAFAMPEDGIAEKQRIAQWRKHPELHGWMRELYRQKGGAVQQIDDGHTLMGENFNAGEGVELTLADLDALEVALNTGALPETYGFFFGHSTPEDEGLDRAFVKQARAAIAEGMRVFYTSWW